MTFRTSATKCSKVWKMEQRASFFNRSSWTNRGVRLQARDIPVFCTLFHPLLVSGCFSGALERRHELHVSYVYILHILAFFFIGIVT